ncbi:hypothetical protein C7C45_13665 [Micromonospora arborensis]|uniref:Uncharacterized protein n=1 Tax=Micromonospora arborensis TaxID=2116518 RepID=A0A318NJD5_9ACTN|nr:hypothetical protein [Micromonospora arborensis]PYC70422.1 hypothetical protein C7C45_13665 [Micromonospora arborensis]
MTSQRSNTKSTGRARAIGLSGGLIGILALLLVVSVAGGDGQSILSGLQSSSSATPAPKPTPESRAQLDRACIAQTKGNDAVAFFQRDIPADRWGDPVRGTASTASEPYVLWLFDADCTPHRALDVPPRTSRTFRAQVGQVWYYAEAAAGQPEEGCACRVFSPANSGAEQKFSDTGRLTYHLN